MIIFKTAADATSYLRKLRSGNTSIGFVPTMGALHDGHLSLIGESRKQNAVSVCSIFVNPSQFNNREDFRLYPVTLEKDIGRLIGAGCDILFLPSENEIYPESYVATRFELGELEYILEGKYRPGHFQGVCQVVDRLLNIISPDRLYLGSKDYQQCMVIRKLADLRKQEKPEINIIGTVREKDGLAMSSRNARLNEDQRQRATAIYKALVFMREHAGNGDLNEAKDEAARQLEANGFVVDYVEIADASTLKPATGPGRKMVGLIAATIGNVRLIDNMPLN